jgi:hypothetical protein
METWHDRLDFALKKRGKKWAELVQITGLSKPSVYAWRPNAKKRTEMMNGDNAAVVCAWLQISNKWLFEGVGESGLEPDRLEKFMGAADVVEHATDDARKYSQLPFHYLNNFVFSRSTQSVSATISDLLILWFGSSVGIPASLEHSFTKSLAISPLDSGCLCLPDVHMASINTNTAPPTIHFTKFKTRSIRLQSTICSVATPNQSRQLRLGKEENKTCLTFFLTTKLAMPYY